MIVIGGPRLGISGGIGPGKATLNLVHSHTVIGVGRPITRLTGLGQFVKPTLYLPGVTLAILLAPFTAWSQGMPANPSILKIKQPNGSSFTARLRGDEHQGWMETTDGYTVVKNSKTGFFEYAKKAADGKLIPSGIVVTAEGMAKMPLDQRPTKGLRPPRND